MLIIKIYYNSDKTEITIDKKFWIGNTFFNKLHMMKWLFNYQSLQNARLICKILPILQKRAINIKIDLGVKKLV